MKFAVPWYESWLIPAILGFSDRLYVMANQPTPPHESAAGCDRQPKPVERRCQDYVLHRPYRRILSIPRDPARLTGYLWGSHSREEWL